jgi:hypothetical protein
MTMILISPTESTQVAAIAVSNAYAAPRTDYLRTSATNGAPMKPTVSVESTALFIHAHYDNLFRRLAE